MTQLDPLADALAATCLQPDLTPGTSVAQPSVKPANTSFASTLRSGQTMPTTIPETDTPSALTATPHTSSSPNPPTHPPEPSSAQSELVSVDDTILQAIRKREDRIFFSQYENQMSAFVRDPSRYSLELGSMNAYQRLLIHRCADQFQLQHQLHRSTHCITLSKTPATSHPSALLSLRAREFLIQRDVVHPLNAHPTLANLTSATSIPAGSSSPTASTSTSSPSSPAPVPAATLSPASGAPKAGFKIMRRDPSSSRQSRLRSGDNDASAANSDSDKAAAKARKDMTLEEREASYKAARARIFGDLTTSRSTSPTSSTSQLDQTKEVEQAKDPSSVRETKPSPTSSATSSPVASIAGGRSGSRRKVPSSASSVTSQDGSSQRTRANGRGKAALNYASDSTNDDLEFCRALPLPSNSAPFGGPQQSSPLALPGHVAHGYFPSIHPSHLQQSQSNPNLRSRAPAFHPQGSSTPAYAQGGALRYPDMGVQLQHNGQLQAQRSWPQPGESSANDAFPALSSTLSASSQNGMNGSRQAQPPSNARNANAQASGSGACNRSQSVGQEHLMNGVGAWAQQTSTYVQNNAAHRHPQQPQQCPQYPHPQSQPTAFQQGLNPYQMGAPAFALPYAQPGQPSTAFSPAAGHAGTRSTTSSRASSQRGGTVHSSRGGRDDAVSVCSISSTASSRSASLSGMSAAAGSVPPSNGGSKPGSGSIPALPHPSLPARPAWLSSNNSVE